MTVREYKEVVADLVTSNAESKRIGKDFIEFGKDIINARVALSFKRQDVEKQLAEFGPLPKL
jgi:hypothetical protein